MENNGVGNVLQESFKVAVVGSGYWGKNHVRNFDQLGHLSHVCDKDTTTLDFVSRQYPHVCCTPSYDEILLDQEIGAVVIATPAATHARLAEAALEAGKHVLVEKPIALDMEDAQGLVNRASSNGSVLMVGHILLYHPAVIKLKEMIDQGTLGKIRYIQSNRLSMGKVRSEENILWSFAPHDVSMILYLLSEMPAEVVASGQSHLQPGVEDVTISHLTFKSGAGAHIYVSWMNPFKEHRLVIIGDKKMAVFEDSLPDKKLRLFHHSFEWVNRHPNPLKGLEEVVPIVWEEPLRAETLHFLDCIRTHSRPRSDGEEGLRTLCVLQKCFESMKNHCYSSMITEVDRTPPAGDYFAHETAIIDEPVQVGTGTKIWHFSHVLSNAVIGKDCNVGQNVLIGKGVVIGDHCKIQNNVAVYEGVTLEDYVFCGPSMVFTNVHNPRCEIPRMKEIRPTLVKKGATIGANATVICGNTIGKYAFVGAGAVVTRDVEDYSLMIGNPARRVGWMCRCGVRLEDNRGALSILECPSCGLLYWQNGNDRIAEYMREKPVEKVPLLDLRTQYLSIKDEVDGAIRKVIDSQRFIGGPEVEALETEIAEYCGSKHAIGVSSGTDALLVSLMALGVGPGDEVITTPFTFFATVGSIMRLGATPVFADIERNTFNIDPERVKKAVTAKTKAILPVHLFGQCADMDPLLEISMQTGIPIVEDAAQAIGAEYKGIRAGSMGTVGCFSFFPSKNLGAFGDGGIITTNDDDLAELLRVMRNQGAKPKYFHKVLGGNFRLDAIQAAVLRVKLRHLDSWTARRMANADFYTTRLKEFGLAGTAIATPHVVQDRHVFNQYVIRTDNRDALKQFLGNNGVGTEIYYPQAMHLQECVGNGIYKKGDFPVSEVATKMALALPVYPELTDKARNHVVAKIVEFFGQ